VSQTEAYGAVWSNMIMKYCKNDAETAQHLKALFKLNLITAVFKRFSEFLNSQFIEFKNKCMVKGRGTFKIPSHFGPVCKKFKVISTTGLDYNLQLGVKRGVSLMNLQQTSYHFTKFALFDKAFRPGTRIMLCSLCGQMYCWVCCCEYVLNR
jgi:hypothetical protein